MYKFINLFVCNYPNLMFCTYIHAYIRIENRCRYVSMYVHVYIKHLYANEEINVSVRMPICRINVCMFAHPYIRLKVHVSFYNQERKDRGDTYIMNSIHPYTYSPFLSSTFLQVCRETCISLHTFYKQTAMNESIYPGKLDIYVYSVQVCMM